MRSGVLASVGAAIAVAVIAVGVVHWRAVESPAAAAADAFALVDRYCDDCHNESEFAGGLTFDALDRHSLAAEAETWESAVRKLRGGQMPPPGQPRPPVDRIEAVVTSVESVLDEAASAAPNPGAPALHRLNRTEYQNAIRDLLALPIDAAALLPADDSSGGFDNIATALSVSPALMQAYVSAAAKISRLAIGDPTVSPELATYRAPRELVQTEHFEGLPLGTRGGMTIEHVFPLDAEYELTVGRAGGGFGITTVGDDEDIEVTLNGERVRLLSRGAPRSFRLRVPAGPQTLGVALVREQAPRGVDDLYSVLAVTPGVQSVSIMGPLDATGPGDTPSRRRVFVCRPETANEEPACARRIVDALATRAFRRPVDTTTLDMLMRFYADGAALRGFETGVQYALARVLVDPRFVFRFERQPSDLSVGDVYPLDDYALASRLSFFLWSSIPDDALLDIARRGRLSDPATLEREVARMLADPKADALIANVAGQWLMLRQLDAVAPTAKDFDGNLRAAMRRETELLFSSIVREDRSVVDLLDARYTFVDERLARHYGMPHIRGSRFRRVELAEDDPRRGLLGQASLLTLTSAPNRTSPVKRGAWVLEHLLGTPPPAPPEGVETNLEAAAGAAPTTLRERLERHRADPSCASCHRNMDGIGFALENFDAIGRWRDADAGHPVDATGELANGTPLAGPAGLRAALVERRDLFVAHLTEQLLTYALGRQLEYYDMPAVRAIVRGAADDDFKFSALVAGVARSVPFRLRRAEPAGDGSDAPARPLSAATRLDNGLPQRSE